MDEHDAQADDGPKTQPRPANEASDRRGDDDAAERFRERIVAAIDDFQRRKVAEAGAKNDADWLHRWDRSDAGRPPVPRRGRVRR